MDKLSQRGSKFTLVLNDTGANVFGSAHDIVYKLINQTDIVFIFVACIKHDKDIDNETGNVKTEHYHLVVSLGANCRVGTFLNYIVDTFHCNENQVTIEKCSSIEMQTRYLIHLDEIDKWRYDEADVVSNDTEQLHKYMTMVPVICDIDDLIKICTTHKNNLLKLMSAIGYENYKKYRVVIADIRREILGLPIK